MKAILLVRVSTDRQSFDEQELNLFNMAIGDGYTENNIIPICEKESGRKLKEDERKGLNRMKELIESDSSINCVYAWEISRIARKKKILFSILEYLTERKIQLIIKEPYIKLLNSDGSINDGAETVFTLFAQIAESEMRNKDVRFKRAKEEMKRNHQYRGGFLPLGYTVNDEGKIVIDEEKASIVRLLFNLYVDGISQYKLSEEMKSRGYDISYSHVTKILGNINYVTGEFYPIIISKELWEKKCNQAKLNATSTDKSHYYYYGAKLIKCECGCSYVAQSSTVTYLCKARHVGKPCNNTKNISINVVDSILWYVAKKEYIVFLTSKNLENRKQLEADKEIYKQKLNALQSQYDKLDEKLSRFVELYGELAISKEQYQAIKEKINNERIELDNNKVNYTNEIERIDSLLSTEYVINNEGGVMEWWEHSGLPLYQLTLKLNDELDTLDDKRKYEIVHQFIKSVHIEYINNKQKRITINYMGGIGIEKEVVYNVFPCRQAKNTIIEDEKGNVIEDFQYTARFKKKPIKDIEAYRIKNAEYQRNRRKMKKGA